MNRSILLPRARSWSVGLVLGALASGCDFQPGFSPASYSLSEKTLERLDEAYDSGGIGRPEAVGAQVLGALEMLFGTPAAPSYLTLEEWVDEEIDRSAGGYDELDDESFDEIRSQNQKRFKRQLNLIEARRYAEVPKPLYAADLWETWQDIYLPALLEDPGAPAEDEELGTIHDEVVEYFAGYYPTLRESAEMYRQQCLHCHGTEGGGNGPTAEYLDPLPRDYRKGLFKWVAVDRNQRPRREDLLKILLEGATGTAMPSFKRFSRGELEGLIDYVRLLSVRGEVEGFLVGEAISDGELSMGAVQESYELAWANWDQAYDRYVAFDGDIPRAEDVTPEMIEHGREMFLGNVANCYTCHGPDGRGDGESIWEADPDGATTFDDEGNEVPLMVKRLDEWGNESNPRNFRVGIFRGGNRPIDFYRRIKYGIGGTIMPAADAQLADEDIWAIVYYVLSIAEEHDVVRRAEARMHAAEASHSAAH